MATKPTVKKMKNLSQADILNNIRAHSSENYQNAVPMADQNNIATLSEIGKAVTSTEGIKNEFLSALWNRIARVIITNKTWSNPIEFFKRGELELGEIIEEVFVNIAKPFQFNQPDSESTVFKREIPDVRSTFYLMNYQKFYECTISDKDLKLAFLSWSGVDDLIAKMTESMYTAANYDEFLTMRYLVARQILDGKMYPYTIGPTGTVEQTQAAMEAILALSDNFEFLSPEYNISGVHNAAPKSEQYFLVTPEFKAKMNVEILAVAFNMDKAEFMGHLVTVPKFGKLDTARLAELFAGDPTYEEISEDKLEALNEINGVFISADWFMIYDNLNEFTEIYNPRGLYWNYYLHTWKTFGVSPFAVNALLLPESPTVTSVTVSPATATIQVGEILEMTATVTGTNYPPNSVTWSSDSENVTVSPDGHVTGVSATSIEATITATSTFDTTKKGIAKITVTA